MRRFSENGNALFLILIAVILFGALSYTVANMMRPGGGEKIAEEKASLYADEIITYAQQIRRAVQDMRISNGCEDVDISFQNTVEGGYTNGTNTACQVYHSDGGGLNYLTPVSDWLDTAQTAQNNYGILYFQGMNSVDEMGTTVPGDADSKELLFFIPYLKRSVCLQINERLGVTNPLGEPPQESGGISFGAGQKFTGSYAHGSALSLPPPNFGKPSACFEGAGTPPSGTYHYYLVLLPR